MAENNLSQDWFDIKTLNAAIILKSWKCLTYRVVWGETPPRGKTPPYCFSQNNLKIRFFYLSHTRLYREYITSGEMYSLHLTHPKWTHTRSSGQPCYSARGAVGGLVPFSRTPQLWYWRRRECWLFTPPTNNPCRTWDSNPQPLDYKSNSLTIRPRLPQDKVKIHFYCNYGLRSREFSPWSLHWWCTGEKIDFTVNDLIFSSKKKVF